MNQVTELGSSEMSPENDPIFRSRWFERLELWCEITVGAAPGELSKRRHD